jgi:hypothetical protein
MALFIEDLMEDGVVSKKTAAIRDKTGSMQHHYGGVMCDVASY